MLTGRLGKLPLPIGSILKLFEDELHGDNHIQFDLDTSPVSITFNQKQPKSEAFKLDQIVCKDGVLQFNLSAPAIVF